MLLDNSCQLARLMVTSPAARGTRLTRNVFLRHRSRRRIDLMNSHVRFTIAVRRDVPTAAAIALHSFDPRCSPTIRQRSSITTSTTQLRLYPLSAAYCFTISRRQLHPCQDRSQLARSGGNVRIDTRSATANCSWLTPAGLDEAERGHASGCSGIAPAEQLAVGVVVWPLSRAICTLAATRARDPSDQLGAFHAKPGMRTASGR